MFPKKDGLLLTPLQGREEEDEIEDISMQRQRLLSEAKQKEYEMQRLKDIDDLYEQPIFKETEEDQRNAN